MAEHLGCGIIEEEWRKGPWTAEEDRLLIEHVELHGEGRWSSVAGLTGLKRNGKSCRLRWVNYLRPDLKRGRITPHEETIILELHARWGNRWSTIARSLPGRTDNEIKNFWRTHFKKKPKVSSDSNVKSKDYEQIQQNDQVDMKRVMSLLDGSDNRVSYLPQVRQDMVTNNTMYTNTAEEHGFLCSMFNGYAYVPEASHEDILLDGLWNLDDIHGNLSWPAQQAELVFTV